MLAVFVELLAAVANIQVVPNQEAYHFVYLPG